MAIDDNTVYGLTGAQLKDLVAQTKAAAQSTIREITAADKNWNRQTGEQGTPDIVAAWKLPSGLYEVLNVPVYLSTGSSNNYDDNIMQCVILVQSGKPGMPAVYTWYDRRNMDKLYMAQVSDSGSYSQGKKVATFTAI